MTEPTECAYCANIHAGKCPLVKSFEYEFGMLKRVEFFGGVATGKGPDDPVKLVVTAEVDDVSVAGMFVQSTPWAAFDANRSVQPTAIPRKIFRIDAANAKGMAGFNVLKPAIMDELANAVLRREKSQTPPLSFDQIKALIEFHVRLKSVEGGRVIVDGLDVAAAAILRDLTK